MGLSGRGEAGSKREAEREAASALLAALEKAAPVRRRGARA
jgi:dsRNA-specific ribonuclease